MACAEAAAQVFQEHRDELGFVNRAQCREGDLLTAERDGRVVGAVLGNHCVRKPQTTVYELAVLPAYRREGIASELIDQFADESPHGKLVAKCPEPLAANEFYRATGWDLAGVENGKHRPLNVWEYDATGVDIVTTGRPDLVSVAEQYGWLRGSRLDYLDRHESRGHDIDFIDLHWEDPDRAKLMKAVDRHSPQMAIAGDYNGENIETINEFADELRQYVDSVIIVPHNPGEVDLVPTWATVGYSTPSDYAGTDAPVWEYRGRDVHILGGTVNEVLDVYGYLADSVVSLDCNSFHRAATQYAKWWGQGTPHWNKLPNSANPNNCKRAYEMTMINLTYKLRESGIKQHQTGV